MSAVENRNILATNIAKKPYFSLQEILSAETTPSLPASDALCGKIMVLITGLRLSPESAESINERTEAGALAFGMDYNRNGIALDNTTVHISKLRPQGIDAIFDTNDLGRKPAGAASPNSFKLSLGIWIIEGGGYAAGK